jgi:hypothetical protein
MMRAKLKNKIGSVLVEVEAENTKDLFKLIAEADEVFNAEQSCGLCNSTDIHFVVRTVDDNNFYELRCSCGGSFSFGQKKKGGGLFPKRKDGDNWLPNSGWKKWQRVNQEEADSGPRW